MRNRKSSRLKRAQGALPGVVERHLTCEHSMIDLDPGVPQAEPNLFEVTIVSQRELTVAHRAEGHVYTYKVVGEDGSRVLAEPTITAGDHAHDPLAYRHAALLRARTAAVGAQMIDKEHSVVTLSTRGHPHRA